MCRTRKFPITFLTLRATIKTYSSLYFRHPPEEFLKRAFKGLVVLFDRVIKIDSIPAISVRRIIIHSVFFFFSFFFIARREWVHPELHRQNPNGNPTPFGKKRVYRCVYIFRRLCNRGLLLLWCTSVHVYMRWQQFFLLPTSLKKKKKKESFFFFLCW